MENTPNFDYFVGFEKLYLSRLKHMFPSARVLKCPNIVKQNHLLGQCALCGTGKLSTTRKTRISFIALDRVYSVYGPSNRLLASLQTVKRLYPNCVTNLEFPVPVVTYGNSTAIPIAFDIETRTVLDVGDRADYKKQRVLRVCKDFGLNYVLINLLGHLVLSETRVYSAPEVLKVAQAESLKNALREFLK